MTSPSDLAPLDTMVAPPPIDVREHLTSPTTRAALTIQQCILRATRVHLTGNGFRELLPPVIGPVTDPGIRGSKQIDIDFYGHRYKLMTSAILYKQASLLAFDKIFFIAPNVRLEPLETASTSRHLAEFHQIDVEVAGATRSEVLGLLEDLVRHIVTAVVEECAEQLAPLGRDVAALSAGLRGAFGRMTHPEAVARLDELGHRQDPGAEIDWQAEAKLSHSWDRPFFVTGYPKGTRGFYDREDPASPGVLRSFDLLAPEGYGELCSGSEREHDYATIIARMRETGENPAKYGWYLDLLREGVPASAGFGLGLERLTRYVAGLHSVWQTTLYPKLPGRTSP